MPVHSPHSEDDKCHFVNVFGIDVLNFHICSIIYVYGE